MQKGQEFLPDGILFRILFLGIVSRRQTLPYALKYNNKAYFTGFPETLQRFSVADIMLTYVIKVGKKWKTYF